MLLFAYSCNISLSINSAMRGGRIISGKKKLLITFFNGAPAKFKGQLHVAPKDFNKKIKLHAVIACYS